jgi:hypothetical protein
MKPCFSKRKLIVWLALGELDARRAQDLRAHLETCAGCRRYLEEMSAVGERLAAAETAPEIEASASFHQRLLSRLRAEQAPSPWETLAARLHWRAALPVMGAAAVVVLMLALFPRQPAPSPPIRVSRPEVPPPSEGDLSPTVANYQRAALRSLDDLDELLTRQARRKLSPTPIYTASVFSMANVPD